MKKVILSAVMFALSGVAMAQQGDVRREIREGAYEVNQAQRESTRNVEREKAEARREYMQADTPREKRKAIRDGRREVRQAERQGERNVNKEKREARREVRKARRD